jgi:hypothetical protein
MGIINNGIVFIVSDEGVKRYASQRLNNEGHAPHSAALLSFNIGQHYEEQGGVYAGITRGGDRMAQYHLFVGPEADSEMNWNDAMAWAKALNTDGKNDFVLPLRNEQSLAYANIPELFKKEYYWSGVTHAADSDYAWTQYFGYGLQYYWIKSTKGRVRAFRRILVIQ